MKKLEETVGLELVEFMEFMKVWILKYKLRPERVIEILGSNILALAREIERERKDNDQ